MASKSRLGPIARRMAWISRFPAAQSRLMGVRQLEAIGIAARVCRAQRLTALVTERHSRPVLTVPGPLQEVFDNREPVSRTWPSARRRRVLTNDSISRFRRICPCVRCFPDRIRHFPASNSMRRPGRAGYWQELRTGLDNAYSGPLIELRP